MKAGFLSKAAAVFLVFILLFGMLLSGCGGSGNDKVSTSTAPGSGDAGGNAAERSKVSVWYLWGGMEGETMEQIIRDFNGSQDKYTAEGLSVPDEQKIKVAVAGGNGPDVTDSFDSNVVQYATEGIALALDDLIARDAYDLSDFIPAALDSGRYQGKIYSLPINVSFLLMYYNKDLMAEAGITEVPGTARELLDAAVAATKLNADGSIDILGFPSYPAEYFNALAYALGATFVNEDGTASTFDNDATLEAMKLFYEYNSRFGVENIKQIQSSGKYLDPTDPFLQGKQVFRFDGSWLSSFIKNLEVDIDYGIAAMPYIDGKPEIAGSGLNTSSMFYITKTAKNVDGAWEFMKYLFSAPVLSKFMSALGSPPATYGAMKEPAMESMADGAQIMEMGKNPNLKVVPNFPKKTEFFKIIGEELELMYNLKQNPEETMKIINERLKSLF